MRLLTRAKEATGAGPLETVQEGYVDETSLSHMTRVAIESRSREAADWISSHVRGGRRYRYRPRPGRGLRPPQPAASQLLGDHAPFFKGKRKWADSDKCLWCRPRREHLSKECKEWAKEIRTMCGKAGNTSGDRDAEKEVGSSRAGKASVVTSEKPATVRDLLGSEKFTEAVLAFLKDAKAGAIKEGIPKRIRMNLGFSFLPFFSLPFFFFISPSLFSLDPFSTVYSVTTVHVTLGGRHRVSCR